MEKPKGLLDENWENLTEETIALIRLCLLMSVLSLVARETTAVKLMKKITNRYEKLCKLMLGSQPPRWRQLGIEIPHCTHVGSLPGAEVG